jgi:hypothetical protein
VTVAVDLLVRSRMEPLFWLALVWLFFTVSEARR